MDNIRFVFFGTSEFSVHVLEALFENNLYPLAVVTFPDMPVGRNLVLTPNPIKAWAEIKGIRVIEVTTFKDEQTVAELKNLKADVFVVASFGKILPASIIYMPPYKTLNVHPSLLPRLRGPAPIQGAILGEDKTGISIMRLDEKMDEGPILKVQEVEFSEWPTSYSSAETILGEAGGTLLAEILPLWIRGEVRENSQDDTRATYTKKIEKSDADITHDNPETAYRKILAYEVWPRARLKDLIVTAAHLENGKLVVDKIIPPGKKEMYYEDYLRGVKKV